MKLSARNVLPATVKAVTPGAVDTEVVVELTPGIEMVSYIREGQTRDQVVSIAGKPDADYYSAKSLRRQTNLRQRWSRDWLRDLKVAVWECRVVQAKANPARSNNCLICRGS
jgi:molybdopterin-binding protein